MITFMHKPLYIKIPQDKTVGTVLHLHVHLHAQTTIHKKDPNLKQYRTVITPFASKRYSTYAVTVASFSCLPRKAPLLREIRTLRQVAHKLHGYIYTMVFALRGNTALAIYFNAVMSTSLGHRWSPAATICIYFNAVILTASGHR